MQIRNLRKDDFFLLNEMDWTPLPKERDSIYLLLAVHQAECSFIAKEGDRVTGVLLCSRSADGKSIYVHHLLVEGKFRKKGAGSRLMERLHDYAAKERVERIWLLTDDRIRPFYERFDYRESYDFLSPELKKYLNEVKKNLVLMRDIVGEKYESA